MRDIRPGTAGPAPKPISRRNTSGAGRPKTIGGQLMHYNRTQGHPQKRPAPLAPAFATRQQRALTKGVQRATKTAGSQQISVQHAVQDFLSGIGLGGAAHPIRRLQHPGGRMEFPGFGKVPGEIKITEGAAPRPALSPAEKVIEGLRKGHAQAGYRDVKAARSAELTQRAKAAEQRLAEGTGEEAFRASKRELKGKLPGREGQFHGLRDLTDEQMSQLREHVQNHPDLKVLDKHTVWDAVRAAHLHGTVPTPSEYKLLNKAFGPDVTKELFNPTRLAKYKHIAVEMANIPRALMASFDVSAPMRQGLVGLVSHPVLSGKELGGMMKAFASEKAYHNWRAKLEQDPRYAPAVERRLALTDVEHTLANREEPFQSNYAEHLNIPKTNIGPGTIVRKSGRAYNRFLVGQRFNIYNHLLDHAEKSGRPLSEQAQNQLADLVNAATGRGQGKPKGFFERNAVELNATLFSPRLIKSRFDFLNPMGYHRLDPYVRREKIKMAAQTAVAISSFLTLMSRLAGVKVQADPRSSDFGKIRIGNTRIDVGGGFNQYIRVIAQAISNGEIDPNTGEVKHGQTPDILTRFLRGKMAPTPSLGTELLFRQNYAGQKIDPTSAAYWKSRAGQMAAPLAFQDAKNVLDQTHNPAAAAAGYLGSAVGLGIQSYGPKPGSTPKDLRSDLRDNVRKYFNRGLTPQLKEALHLRETREQYLKKVLPKRPPRGSSDADRKTYAVTRFNAQVDLLVKLGKINRDQARKAKRWAHGQDYHKVNSETSRVGRKYFGGEALSDAAKKIRERGGHLYLSDY